MTVTYWKTGMRITSARANRTLAIAKRKQLDHSRTSTTAQTADPELVLSLLANTTYEITGGLLTTSAADAAGDFAYSWSWTGTMTVIQSTLGPHFSITTGTQSDLESRFALADSSSPTATGNGYGTSVAGTTVSVSDYVEVGATAGDLTLLWAQFASNANSTTLKTGSWICATPIIFS